MDLTWQDLSSINDRYGPSFYLLDLERFLENYARFYKAFQERYENSILAYSYKANYLPILCKMINSSGGFAEVASSLEFELASRIGVPGHKIIFNGPYKTEDELESAFLAGAIVNLDSLYEFHNVIAIAERHPQREFNIGLRCNFPLDTGIVSRFGFEVDQPIFYSVVERISQTQNCSLGGLQCHFHLPHRDIESYARVTRRMAEIGKSVFPDPQQAYLDIGGGFYSKMTPELQAQFPGPIPTWDDYAAAITAELVQVFPPSGGPALIVEPGMALVADTMKFCSQVVAIKSSPARTTALLAGSIYNTNPNRSKRKPPLKVVHAGKDQPPPEVMDLVGYTCMEADTLYEGYYGPLQVGDYVVFDNVGAYTIVLKPPFILPAPPIVSIDPLTSRYQLHRRQETFQDVFSAYAL